MEPAATPTSPPATPIKKKGDWDDSIRTFIYAIVIAVIFRSFLFEPFHIPSGSMKENLLIGDYLFVSKYSYGYSRYSFPLGLPPFEGRVGNDSRPQRGDVVVFRLPSNPRIDYIKRVIGLPGDSVQVREAVVYINGKPLPRTRIEGEFTDDESGYLQHMARYEETLPEGKTIVILQERTSGFANNTGIYRVPEGHYFMMGDNRDNSRDSRFMEEVGFVSEQLLIGRAERIFFSTSGGAMWWQFWKWPHTMRGERFLRPIE